MHHSFAVLVIAEWFHRQREQGWFFFREHGRHLPFRGSVNAYPPSLLPSDPDRLAPAPDSRSAVLSEEFFGVAHG